MKKVNTHIIIHPDYQSYKDFLQAIPNHQYEVEKVYCKRRNTVEKVRWNNVDFVVKRYRVPVLINRLVYTFFRKSKAQRSYENAQKLLRIGISTATPVGYIIQKKNGLLHTVWFISLCLPAYTLYEYHLTVQEPDKLERLWKGLSDFMLNAHLHKYYFLDNNGGNILVQEKTDGLHFSIIDINRIEQGRIPSLYKSMKSFDQLGLDVSALLSVLNHYTRERNFSLERCLYTVLKHRMKRIKKLEFKRSIYAKFSLKQH